MDHFYAPPNLFTFFHGDFVRHPGLFFEDLQQSGMGCRRLSMNTMIWNILYLRHRFGLACLSSLEYGYYPACIVWGLCGGEHAQSQAGPRQTRRYDTFADPIYWIFLQLFVLQLSFFVLYWHELCQLYIMGKEQVPLHNPNMGALP